MNLDIEVELDSLLDAIETIPIPGRGGLGGGSIGRPHGVIDRRVEKIDGKDYLVEVVAPESFPARRTGGPGRGKVGKYATPKPRTVENGGGSGSGLWTGSQGDTTLRNATLRHTARATRWAEKHGSLADAPWEIIGLRNLRRAVRAARDFEAENCPVYEQAHVIDDLIEDLNRELRREGR